MEGQTILVQPMLGKGFMMVNRSNSSSSVEMTGVLPLIISWLSLRYNFSFIYLEEIGMHMVDIPKEKGAISILFSGMADIAMGTIYPTAFAYSKVDFTTSWLHSPLSILIPSPQRISFKASSIVAPFQFKVWILILASIIVILIGLYYTNRYTTAISQTFNLGQFNSFNQFGLVYHYVIAIFLFQGSFCYNRRLAVRLVAGVWCLSCAVLGMAYSSTLISYMTAPQVQPIINSLNDIPKVPGLFVTVNRGQDLEAILMNSKEGIYKYLGDMIRRNPNLRCSGAADCVKMVLDGGHVYINGAPVIENIIFQDYLETGKCHLSMARESFMMAPIVIAMQKSSPFLELTNRGLLDLWKNGLINHWIRKYVPKTEACSYDGVRHEKSPLLRLNLGHLAGAFILLIVGLVVSFTVFIGEKFMFPRI